MRGDEAAMTGYVRPLVGIKNLDDSQPSVPIAGRRDFWGDDVVALRRRMQGIFSLLPWVHF